MTKNIQGNPHQVMNCFLNGNSTSQKGMAWHIYSDEREEPTTKNTALSKALLQIWWRNQKLSRQAKVKRLQHHQTGFTTNAKEMFLGRKCKTRKRPTENKPKIIKKIVVVSYISIITLNVNGLNLPTKRYTGWADESMCMYGFPLMTSLCLIPQIICYYYFLFLA